MEDSLQFHKKECTMEESTTDLPPWEQHATVVNMPRFDYQATSALLRASHSGFLITCPIKREKSATKEAIDILQKYFNLSTCASRDTLAFTGTCQNLEKSETEINNEVTAEEKAGNVGENADRKKRRMTANSEEFPFSSMLASNAMHVSVSDVQCLESGISSVYDPNLAPEPVENPGAKINSGDAHLPGPFTGKSVMPSLVKLARNGILFFSLPGNCSPNIVRVLVKIFQAMNSGEMKPPAWCHRILPVQATCLLKKEDLHNIVVKLVKEHIGNTESKAETPLKFAVGYNRRGVEGNEVGRGGSQKILVVESSLLGRNECFQVVAGAVKEVATHSSVDLLSPEMAVLVEVLPLTGVHGSFVAAVSVLPGDLVNAKPRLCVKPLVLDVASNKKKQCLGLEK